MTVTTNEEGRVVLKMTPIRARELSGLLRDRSELADRALADILDRAATRLDERATL